MVETHELIITRAHGLKDTKYLWLCLTHTYAHGIGSGCEHHLSEFMTVPVYDRQERLI